MKIITTESYIFNILKLLNYDDHVIGAPDDVILNLNKNNELNDNLEEEKTIIALDSDSRSDISKIFSIKNEILFDKIKELNFNYLFMAVKDLKDNEVSNSLIQMRRELARKLVEEKINIKLFSYNTVKNIVRSIEEISDIIGKKAQGVQIAQRYKAQLVNWIDAYYERIKNKKVIVLREVNEKNFQIYGLWVADIVNLISSKNLVTSSKTDHMYVSWDDIKALNPDTIIIAPNNYTLSESLKTFKFLEKLPGWDDLLCVKKTEVYFCDGISFQSPLNAIKEGASYIISAVAGLPSGVITKRDSFQRLRWVELMRHKI